MKLFDYEWECCMEGGRRMHPDFPYMWYDYDQVNYIDNELCLSVANHPNRITHWDGWTYFPQYGCGLVRSVETFSYGVFTAEIKMPKGVGLWPAFWLCGDGEWPSSGEIDIAEGYSKKNNYLKLFSDRFPWLLPNWNISTNVHYEENKKHKQIGAKNITVCNLLKDPSEEYVKYKCIWKPDEIRIYVNDKLIREDKKAVKTFKSDKMHVIFDVLCEDPKKYDISMGKHMFVRNFEWKAF